MKVKDTRPNYFPKKFRLLGMHPTDRHDTLRMKKKKQRRDKKRIKNSFLDLSPNEPR